MYTSPKTERKNSQLRSFLENNILIEPSPYLDISSLLFGHRGDEGCALRSHLNTSPPQLSLKTLMGLATHTFQLLFSINT